ncbi:hypothetical protein Leryth_012141 [Lithospermum erythrorhizon]|uniref:Cytochrome P450 n=1 Tax=Lithospermum erythrorhizon TaxID=34254 RepID=A0AAV3RRJ6_LITER|nr:hypothetical protein Leryth_012141 [Lithospermum erythrorhizon]
MKPCMTARLFMTFHAKQESWSMFGQLQETPKCGRIQMNFILRDEENEIDFRGAHFQLLPFGAGRRIYPGMTVSMMIIEYIIAHLLYFFDWELPDGMKMEDVSLEEVVGITITRGEA